jgi:hypothetical protein
VAIASQLGLITQPDGEHEAVQNSQIR